MKKLILMSALSYALSSPALATIEQGIKAYHEGDLKQAVAIISQVDNNNFEKPLYLAKIYFDQGDLDKAESYIEDAKDLNETNSEIHFFHGKVMAKQSQNVNMFSKMAYAKDILKAFTAAVKFSPDNVEYRQHLLTLHLVAPSILGGDTNIALEQAIAIKKLDAKSGAVALIKVYAKRDETEKLDEIYHQAVNDFPEEPALYYHRGMFYQQEEDFGNAVTELGIAAKLSVTTEKQLKSKYMAIYQLGRTSVLSENYLNEGENALNQYIAEADIQEYMPAKDWAKFRLANIIELKGDRAKAKALYEEVQHETNDKDLQSKAQKRMKKLG